MFEKGIIVSLQIYSDSTSDELAQEVLSADAIAIRCNKEINVPLPKIGLKKIKGVNIEKNAFITPDVEMIKRVEKWSDYVAVDYRKINDNLLDVSNYARENGLKIVADIGSIEDYENIKKLGLHYEYIATTLSHLHLQKRFEPDIMLIEKLKNAGEKNIIAEGNYRRRDQVKAAFACGARNVCIGAAITDVYKLTRKYTTINPGGKYDREREIYTGLGKASR